MMVRALFFALMLVPVAMMRVMMRVMMVALVIVGGLIVAGTRVHALV